MVSRAYKEAVLVGTLGSPDDTGRSSRWVKSSVWAIAFVSIAELAVNPGAQLCV